MCYGDTLDSVPFFASHYHLSMSTRWRSQRNQPGTAKSEVDPPPSNPTSPKRKLRGRKRVQSNAEEVADKRKEAKKDDDQSNEDKSDGNDSNNDSRLVAA